MMGSMKISLFGLGAPTAAEAAQIAALLAAGTPTVEAVRDFLLVLPAKLRQDAATALLLQGVAPAIVAEGLRQAQAAPRLPWKAITGTLTLASAAVSAYHGAKRNQSIGWGLWWFVMGAVFPVVTPTIALAQGLGHPKEK